MAMNPNNTGSLLRPEYDFSLSSLSNEDSSRGLIFRAINPGSYVLDVGCDTGRFGQALIADKQCRVDGVEAWHPAAELAQIRLNQVFVRAIETEQSFAGLKGYDVVLFLCVLEHLQDPWAALKGAYEVLKPGGMIYVVVPNISHISIIRRLLVGRFDYTEHGTMDRTHLRWFTRKGLSQSLENSGFSNVEVQGMPLVPYVGGSSKMAKTCSSMLVRLLPDLFSGSILGSGIKLEESV
jgi:2-polyprenyl-3-methyl-5-hydroxy-6-metoxy-1,4-benzoquinol methylase